MPAERVVRLVAGVLVDPVLADRGPDVLAAPGRGPHRRVVDGELIQQGLGVDAGEPLHHVQVPRGAAEGRTIGEVGGVDDAGCLPPSGRTESPSQLRISGGACVLVHPHDARVVDHLDENHDRVVRLHDALQVVVEHRQHRRPRGRAEAHQAPLGERALLGVVVGTRRIQIVLEPPRGPGVGPGVGRGQRRPPGGLGPGGHRRLPAVRRIDDDGGAPPTIDLEAPGAPIHPERVVAAHVSGRPGRPVAAHRWRLARRLGDHVPLVRNIEDPLERLAVRRQRRRLFLRQGQLLAVLGGTLQGGQGGDVIGPGQIRPAVGPAWNLGARLRVRGRRRQHQSEEPAGEDPQAHGRRSAQHVALHQDRGAARALRSASRPTG